MSDIRKTIVVAQAKNGIIGRDGGMPWRLSTDLKRFKAMTIGKPIIAGRKTFDSFPAPLPGRHHVVVSRQAQIDHPDVETVTSLEEALSAAEAVARNRGENEIFIVGGGEIYRQSMALVDRLCVTHVEADIDGDTSFPAIDPDIWKSVETLDVPPSEKDDYPTRFVIYERR